MKGVNMFVLEIRFIDGVIRFQKDFQYMDLLPACIEKYFEQPEKNSINDFLEILKPQLQ